MIISSKQSTPMHNRILVTNKVNIDARSDFCWRKNRFSEKIGRMEFGTKKSRDKSLMQESVIVHGKILTSTQVFIPRLGDPILISVLLCQRAAAYPSCQWSAVSPVMRQARKEGTGASCDLFKELACYANTNSTVETLGTKLLMKTMKRDVSEVEVCHALSTLPCIDVASNYSIQVWVDQGCL